MNCIKYVISYLFILLFAACVHSSSQPVTTLYNYVAHPILRLIDLPTDQALDPFTQSIFKKIETTYGANGMNILDDEVALIKKTYLYLIFLTKQEKIVQDPQLAQYKQEWLPFLQDNKQSTPHFPTSQLITSSDWSNIPITEQDLLLSSAWQLLCKAMITDSYTYDYTAINVIHNVENQIFNFIPHIETSYYDQDFTNIRTIAELTRVKIILQSHVKSQYIEQCPEWKSLPLSHKSIQPQNITLEQEIVAFRKHPFYKNTHYLQDLIPKNNQHALAGIHLPSPLKEQIWIYCMIREIQVMIYSYMTQDNLATMLQLGESSQLQPNFFEHTTADYVLLDDALATKSKFEQTHHQSKFPSPPQKHIETIRAKQELPNPHRSWTALAHDHLSPEEIEHYQSQHQNVKVQSWFTDAFHSVEDVASDIGHDIAKGAVDALHGIEDAGLAVGHLVEGAAFGIVGLGAEIVGQEKWGEKYFHKGMKDLEQSTKDLENSVDQFADALKDGIVAPIAELSGKLVQFVTDDQKLGQDMTQVIDSVTDALIDVASKITDASLEYSSDIMGPNFLANNMRMADLVVDGFAAADGSKMAKDDLITTLKAIVHSFKGLLTVGKTALMATLKGIGAIVNSLTTLFIDITREMTYLILSGKILGLLAGPEGVALLSHIDTPGTDFAKTISNHVTNTLEAHRRTINQVMGVVSSIAADVVVDVCTAGVGTAADAEIDAAIMGAADASEETFETMAVAETVEATQTAYDITQVPQTIEQIKAIAAGKESVADLLIPTDIAAETGEETGSEVVEETTEKLTGKTVEKSTEKAVESTSKKAIEKSIAASKNAMKKTTEEVSDAAEEQANKIIQKTGREFSKTAKENLQKIIENKIRQETADEFEKVSTENAEKIGNRWIKKGFMDTMRTGIKKFTEEDAELATREAVKDAAENAAKDAAKGITKEGLENITEESLEQGVQASEKEAAQDLAESAAKKEAKRVMNYMIKKFGKRAVFKQGLMKQVVKKFAENALEESLEDSGVTISKDITATTAKDFTEQEVDTMTNKITKDMVSQSVREKLGFGSIKAGIMTTLGESMNFMFGFFNSVGGYNKDEKAISQQAKESESIETLWNFISEQKMATSYKQLASFTELQKKHHAQIGNALLRLSFSQNLQYSSINVATKNIGKILTEEYTNLLTPNKHNLLPANIGTTWGLISPYLNLYPSQGFPSTTTGRVIFPFAQEIAQAPMIDVPHKKQTLNQPHIIENKLWFNQKVIGLDNTYADGLPKKPNDPLSVAIDMQFIYTVNSAFHTGIYLGGTYHDYESPEYLKSLEAGNPVDINAANLAKMIVLFRESTNGPLSIGVYEHQGKDWIIKEKLPASMQLDQHHIYHLTAILHQNKLHVELFVDDNKQTVWQKSFDVTELSNQRTYGIIYSGAAIEWNQITPHYKLTANQTARPQLHKLSAVEQEKKFKQQLTRIQHPIFGSMHITPVSKHAMINEQYLYATTDTHIPKTKKYSLGDFVLFAEYDNQPIKNIGMAPTGKPNEVIISIITGNVYNQTGSVVAHKEQIWDEYQKTHDPFPTEIESYIDNAQKELTTALNHITFGPFKLDSLNEQAINKGQYIYRCQQTLTINNSPATDYIILVELLNNKLGSMIGLPPSSPKATGMLSLITGNLYAKTDKPAKDDIFVPIATGYYDLFVFENQYGQIDQKDLADIKSIQKEYEQSTKEKPQHKQVATKKIISSKTTADGFSSPSGFSFDSGVSTGISLKPHGKSSFASLQKSAAGKSGFQFTSTTKSVHL